MIEHSINIRVRYSETDQMHYVYYGNYAQYFEMGRAEWLRNLGITYKNIEDSGIMLPVLDLHIRYHKPATYDELLKLTTKVVKKPTVKIEFEHSICNQDNELLTSGKSILVFIDKKRNRPTRVPAYFLDIIKPFFS